MVAPGPGARTSGTDMSEGREPVPRSSSPLGCESVEPTLIDGFARQLTAIGIPTHVC
jgi:hypothetical protein